MPTRPLETIPGMPCSEKSNADASRGEFLSVSHVAVRFLREVKSPGEGDEEWFMACRGS